MHPMQPPSIDSILHGTFGQSNLFQLSQRHDAMLTVRNCGNLQVQPPMGRFPTARVGFRPIGRLFGGGSRGHRGSLAWVGA
jgi:hypothetical protein